MKLEEKALKYYGEGCPATAGYLVTSSIYTVIMTETGTVEVHYICKNKEELFYVLKGIGLEVNDFYRLEDKVDKHVEGYNSYNSSDLDVRIIFK